ncbi:bifunctional hydroxymethylpyrimidine kinase/phosphomethylpyrimidine kinase [Corynebacterium minutissimum]
MSLPRVLSIAGTDPTGGAGIHADLKSFEAAGAYGMAVVTALVAQNTQGVRSTHIPPVNFLQEQLDCVKDDVLIDAVKIGMLGSIAITETVSEFVSSLPDGVPVVCDPVMIASSRDRLLEPAAERAVQELARRATVVTPNLPELAVLADVEEPRTLEEAIAVASEWAATNGTWVVVKGGHLNGKHADNATVSPDGHVTRVPCPRVETKNTHGTGCSLSSALAARLAAGDTLDAALQWATEWIHEAIAHADELHVGKGHGPIDHGHRMRRLALSE